MSKLTLKNLSAAIEAILFIHGEPLTIKKIAQLLKTETDKAEEGIRDLANNYSSGARGITLARNGDEVQLITNPHFSDLLQSFIKEEFEENLSPASLETLAIVAYMGPVNRSHIDYYRGVNSSFILRSLLLRGLVERLPDPKRGGSFLYRTSFDLLKYLGLSRAEDLPEFDKFKEEAGAREGTTEQVKSE